jgi:hypothetical protein
MKQITITLDTPDIIALEKGGDRAAIAKVENYFFCSLCHLLVQFLVL